MKKFTLALAVLAAMGLTACSSNESNSYKGTVLYSAYEGENLKLTVRKDDCDGRVKVAEETVFVQDYDSDIVVGACVKVYNDNTDNISRTKSRSWISRVGVVH